MCGRFALISSPARVAALLNIPETRIVGEWPARYNIAPTQPILAARYGESGPELVALTWGLVPHWAKEPKTGYATINARAETVASKPAFRQAFRHRRCLIPADGFYEWQARPGEKLKQPYYITAAEGDPLLFAGLWEHWEGQGQAIESCTIIVTQANELMRPIHDRMPVILAPSDYAFWLNPDVTEALALEPLLKPFPAERLRAYPVGKRVNSPTHDDPDCLAPLGDGAKGDSVP